MIYLKLRYNTCTRISIILVKRYTSINTFKIHAHEIRVHALFNTRSKSRAIVYDTVLCCVLPPRHTVYSVKSKMSNTILNNSCFTKCTQKSCCTKCLGRLFVFNFVSKSIRRTTIFAYCTFFGMLCDYRLFC